MFNFPGPLWPSQPALFRQLKEEFALRKRRKGSPTKRTPPYAGCYNIPAYWWEGEISGLVITFWGTFKDDGFTGDILVGPFDFYTHGGCWRQDDGKSQTLSNAGSRHQGLPEIAAVADCFARQVTVVNVRFGFTGLEIRTRDVTGAVLRELLPCAAAAAHALLKLKTEPPPLLTAAVVGDSNTVQALLSQGADPDTYASDQVEYGGKPPRRFTPYPLYEAIRRDDAAMVRLLAPRSQTARDNPGMLLWIALENKARAALPVLLELLQAGGTSPLIGLPFGPDDNGHYTAVEHAAALGDLDSLTVLMPAVVPWFQKRGDFIFSAANLRRASALASGPHRREIRELIAPLLAERKKLEAEGRKPVNWKAVSRTVTIQLLGTGFMLAGLLFTGESPRIVFYGFFFNYILRLPTIALFLRWLNTGDPERRRLAERFTRRPSPGRPSFPVTVDTGGGPVIGSLGSYLLLMVLLFACFGFPLVNVADQQFITPWRAVLSELSWALVAAAVWWVQDILDRRICLNPQENLPVNLGYNSNETTVAALTILFGGPASAVSGSPWPALLTLMGFRHLYCLWEDLKWPPADPPPASTP
jgi:hypothetical protein